MMFRNFGIPEMILVLVLALLIFGPGRIGRLGGEIGRSIRGFKREMGQDTKKEAPETE